ncbi:MAG: GTP-binding protein, partial [Hespellia sp.]|nr:GTP-binding protein [Hespellia sp.]
MKVYRTDEIRNVVLLGHGGSGKTSLVEAMLYVSGAVSRMGKIVDGNTVSDFDKEEQKRQFSIGTSLIPIEWEKAKINILDTPGYFDFVGEVEEAVSAADAAIIVVSGKAGVEVGTEKAWELCDKYNLPRMVYVTEMDVDDASFRQVVEDLTEKYGKCIAPRAIPIRENEKLVGYVNVIKNAGRRFTDVGQREECEIPDYCMPNLEICRNTLLEAVAETSDDFMERYFAGEEFSIEEIRAALRTNVMDGTIVPVGMGANLEAQGVVNLLSDIVRFFPSPDKRECAGINRTTNEIFEGNYDFSKAKTAYVFKTMVDPFIGKYSLVKVCSGVVKGDDTLYNAGTDSEAKPGKLYTLSGNKPIEVSELFAGDIGAIAKLGSTRTGDTLSTKGTQVLYGRTEYSQPYTYMKYTTPTKGDEDKVSQALAKMMAEDVTLKTVNDSENRQAL